jgi:hypothetical protein
LYKHLIHRWINTPGPASGGFSRRPRVAGLQPLTANISYPKLRYINAHALFQSNAEFQGADTPVILERCAEMIACAEPTRRSANAQTYQKALGLPNKKALDDILKPFLAKRRDKTILETQRLEAEADLLDFDPEKIPDYVLQDEAMSKTYRQYGFYPLLNADRQPVAYMFKNRDGGGHTCVSDFYMIPLLHVYSKDAQANKRVIQLNHLFLKKTKYVEWQSSVFANLGKINERLIDEGAFNFDGNLQQFKKIWKNMSYNFTSCRELRILGQQPEEFFAFSNAIFHEIDGEYRIDRMDALGIATHAGENYYSPSCSKIYSSERRDDDFYEQERNLLYKDIPEKDRLTFAQWASLMDEVYRVNDNGKWAILFAVLCAFRDYIYGHRKYFTTLFFMGPTNSGKSKIATSMRNLVMDFDTPSYFLNNSTLPSLTIHLEGLRNIIVVMEEYHDQMIEEKIFQTLKAAVYDGEGRFKVKDVASKRLDNSKVNAIPVILGQYAPQRDDGALSNRCILCEVPYKPKNMYTEEEVAVYEKLKGYEKIGLTPIFVDILKLRPLIKKYYLPILTEETKKLKEAIRLNLVNTDGLTRIINSVAFLTSMCRFLEDHAPELKLPFGYEAFFQLACSKVLKQLEVISSSNKLAVYFHTISFLLNQGTLKTERELKIRQPGKITRVVSGKDTEKVYLTPPETKVLYLDNKTIYSLYRRSVDQKEALSEASLHIQFKSCEAYLGFCNSTKFIWEEVKPEARDALDTGYANNRLQYDMKKVENNTSAFIFNYDKLKELMNIDFERGGELPPETDEPDAGAPEGMKEVKTDGNLPF